MKTKHPNSFRPLRIASLIQTALNEILISSKGLDYNLQNQNCSITNVVISSDLKLVSCYFLSSITSKLTVEELIKALNASKHAIRKALVSKVALKYAPELRFIYDHGFENTIQINKVLYLESLKSSKNQEDI